MLKPIKNTLLVFAILLCTAPVWPQAGGTIAARTLTLKEAVGLAYRQNPRVVQARQSIEAARGDLMTAQTLANPQIA